MKLTVYINNVYDNDKDEKIEDENEIVLLVQRALSHLGNIKIYYYPKPKTIWQKITYSLGNIR